MQSNFSKKTEQIQDIAAWIVGIDEAGRGPLAGPVVVAGIAHRYGRRPRILDRIKDSKQLTAKQREAWFQRLTTHPEIRWAAVQVSPRVIDEINIAQATNLGAKKVFQKLSRGYSCAAVLDGGLRLPKMASFDTVIKGDEKLPTVAAASVIAKVTRDRIMVRLHKKFPQYRFDVHKGYGTRLHRQLIGQYGYSKIHRKSFRAAIELA